ncbi:hypothetical protein OIV83_000514 [Microbotryomycetes sp. JL201]|nr:hypothetical protein OIV83_000514 [Microbotryomycetes sp. JL201]
MASTFKAWSRTTPEAALQQVDVGAPSADELQPTEILVETYAAALNPVDTQLRNLSIFRLGSLAHPKGVAADYAGVVLAVGNAVTDFKQGDEVFGMQFQAIPKPIQGALSQIILVDVKASPTVLKPSHLSWAQAASLPLVWLTAQTCLAPPYTIKPPTDFTKSPTIVVLGGSSSVGLYAVQIAKQTLGARVIATCSSRNAAFVRDNLGADVVVDYTSENVVDRLLELRPEEGYTAIIDCVGGIDLIPHLNALLAARNKQLYPEGGSYTTIVGDKTDRSRLGGSTIYLWNPSMVIRHLKGWLGLGPRYACIGLTASAEYLQKAVEATKPDRPRETVVQIDSEYEFENVPKAFERLDSGRARGKVIVRVKKDDR